MTPEARQRREEAAAIRERAQAARDEVLRLTPQQREALQSHREPRAGRRERADGDRFDALTSEQRATMTVYHALIHGARYEGAGGRDGDGGARRVRRMDR